MPGLMLFGRRWAIGSDDFVFPGAFELFIRVTWWIGILVLYSIHKGQFNCSGGGLLNNYLLILLILLAFIIAALSSITYTSMQGTISNPGPRKSLPKLLYIRLALYIPELVWVVVGTVWIADKQVNCERAMIDAIFGTVTVSWVIMVFTLVAVFIFFDPLGRKTVYLADCASRNLESSQSEQLFCNIKKRATRVWEKRIRLLCCCIVQNDDHRVAFTSIAELFRSYFSVRGRRSFVFCRFVLTVVVRWQLVQTAEVSDSGEEREPVQESGEDSDEGPASDAEMGPGPSGSGVLTPEPLESGSSEAEEQGEPAPSACMCRAARRQEQLKQKG